MAENNMKDLLGKKIFFVNPTHPMKNYIISALRDEELEVYNIDNYKLARNVLQKHPDSICFVYIDSDMTLNGWLVFLENITKDEELKSTVIGVISDKLGDKEKAYLEEHADLKGGIHKASLAPQRLLGELKELIANEKAKGRRQYVRANCLAERGNELLWNHNNMVMQLKLVDISTSGVAVKVLPKDVPFLIEKSKIHGATLKVGSKQFLVDFVIYAMHQRDDKTLMITLFLQDTIRALRGEIQDYIYEILQKQLMTSIELLAPDEKEYNKLGKQIKMPPKPKKSESDAKKDSTDGKKEDKSE